MPNGSVLRFAHAFLLLLGAALSWKAFANGTSPGLTIETLAERRVESSTGVEYVRADQLHVGDEIFYTLRVRNSTNAAIQDAVVTKSIPRNTKYTLSSATGPACVIDFSVDGGATFDLPDQLVLHKGSTTSRTATVDDYTDIRWRLRHPLAPGATALLRFRATLK